jgi:hypothetical protein
MCAGAVIASAALRYAAARMLLMSNSLGQTLALLATFLGIGVLVNVLVVYVVAQVLAERKQNRGPNDGGG